MIGSLDITYLEQAWQDYQECEKGSEAALALESWMGENVGLLLQEIRILRTQVEGLQVELEEERQKNQEETFNHMFGKRW